jgi:RHS repeat-associated protein
VIVEGKILAQYKTVYPSTLSIVYFYLDNLGSRRVVVSSGGSAIDRYRYSAWGKATQDVGSDDLRSYTGKDYDASGLIYFNARYYDPTLGRFLTEDPSRKGGNWYAYCDSEPVNRTDPSGRLPVDYVAAENASQLQNFARFLTPTKPQMDAAIDQAVKQIEGKSTAFDRGFVVGLGVTGSLGTGGVTTVEGGVLLGVQSDGVRVAGYGKVGAGPAPAAAQAGIVASLTAGTGDPSRLADTGGQWTPQMGASFGIGKVFFAGVDYSSPAGTPRTGTLSVSGGVTAPTLPIEGHAYVTKTTVQTIELGGR